MERKSSSVFRIDDSVFTTMVVISLVSLLVLAFKWKSTSDCAPVRIQFTAAGYYSNALVTFKANASNGQNCLWNFGDGSGFIPGAATVNHLFKSAGTYMVRVRVDGRCAGDTMLFIAQRVVKPEEEYQPTFFGPTTAMMNEPVTFKDTTKGAASWAWRFGETDKVDATSAEASYRYTTPGNKEVRLNINGREDLVAIRMITILEPVEAPRVSQTRVAPPTRRDLPPMASDPRSEPIQPPGEEQKNTGGEAAKPTVAATPNIESDGVEAFFYEVIDKKKKAADFSAYVCNDLNIPVRFNDETKTFLKVCEDLSRRKRKNVESLTVEVIKGPTNCVTRINVSLSMKSWFQKIL